MTEGLSFPRTATGRSSILPPLPWHYSGDLLTVEYRTDPSAVAALLPDDVAVLKQLVVQLLEQLRLRRSPLVVLFLSGHGDIPMALEAMRRGFSREPRG